jgi:hypothetical protein
LGILLVLRQWIRKACQKCDNSMYFQKLCDQTLLLKLVFFVSMMMTAARICPAVELGKEYAHAPRHAKVHVGTHLLALYNFNYVKKSFDINFYSWWVTSLAGYEANKFVEVSNAYQFDIKNPVTEKITDDLYRTLCRYYATVFHNWNMRDFPFDLQVLKVDMEDTLYELSQIEFVPDIKNSKISKGLVLDGWQILDFTIESNPNLYTTNFGNPLVPNSTYSRLSLVITIKREGLRIFFTSFIGFMIATFLSLLAFLISPQNLSAKFSLSLGSVFAAMTNKYLIDSALPISPTFTLSDAVQMSSFVFILLTVCSGVIEVALAQKDKVELGIKISRIILFLGFGAHVFFLSFFIFRAVNS